jgi:hypothetical protein
VKLIGSLKGWIIAAGAIAGAVAAIVGLVFVFFPGLKPCVGETTAAFEQVDVSKKGPLEAVVSYTIQTHGYQGKNLKVIWSLLRRDRSGIFATVPGFDRQPAATLKPSECSADQGGEDLPVPVTAGGKYKVLLELYPPGNAARITEAQTEFALSQHSG